MGEEKFARGKKRGPANGHGRLATKRVTSEGMPKKNQKRFGVIKGRFAQGGGMSLEKKRGFRFHPHFRNSEVFAEKEGIRKAAGVSEEEERLRLKKRERRNFPTGDGVDGSKEGGAEREGPRQFPRYVKRGLGKGGKVTQWGKGRGSRRLHLSGNT